MTQKKSADIHRLHGNPSNLPELERRDVNPDPVVPDMPESLSAVAKDVWRFLAPELEKSALLTRRDRESFAALCESVAIMRAALVKLRGPNGDYSDLIITDASHQGRIARNPASFVLRSAEDSYHRWCTEFGLTPKSRIALMVAAPPMASGPSEDEDDLELFGS